MSSLLSIPHGGNVSGFQRVGFSGGPIAMPVPGPVTEKAATPSKKTEPTPSILWPVLKKGAYAASFIMPIANVPGAIRHISEYREGPLRLGLDILGEMVVPFRSWFQAFVLLADKAGFHI